MSKLRQTLFLLFIGAIFVWIGSRYYFDFQNKQKLYQNYVFTVGEMISYRSVGSMHNKHTTYEYTVEGVSYLTKSSVPDGLFPGCEYDFNKCSNKRFWVAYEKGDPSNSLINLYIEIQDIENPTPPETLDGFR